MIARPLSIGRTLSLCSVSALCAGAIAGPIVDGEPAGFVSLGISDIRVVPIAGGTQIRCQAHLDNATGSDLIVKSRFHSAFDGMEIVVTDENGSILAQQAFTIHQSPHSPDPREFVLRRGENSAPLVFPLTNDFVAQKTTQVKVRLVGTLPGSGYNHTCSTETALAPIERQ